MIDTTAFEQNIKKLFPSAVIGMNNTGICTWIGLVIDKRQFTVEITPNDGIGVSENNPALDIDFSGHDEVFQDLESVLEFIKSKLAPLK